MSEQESWILVEVEDGSAYAVAGGGKWYSEERLEYIQDGDDPEILCEQFPEVRARLDAGDLFQVKFTGIEFVIDEGDWGYFGYDYGGAWIECHGGYEIIEYGNYEAVESEN